MQHAHGFGGDERRLFGRLGDDGIAGRERGGDLAREDGERKVPGTDADDEAERGRGAGKQRARRLMPIVAQEVGRLAHFRDRVGVRLAGLAHDEANEHVVPRFEDVGGAAQEARRAPRAGSRRKRARRDLRCRAPRRFRRRAHAGRNRRRPFGSQGSGPARPDRPAPRLGEKRARLVSALAFSPSASVARRPSSEKSSPRELTRSGA